MRNKEIAHMIGQGKTDDEIYEIGICRLSLFRNAFFGFKSTKAEKQKMNRQWTRILQIGKLKAKTSPHSSGNTI
jgi:hypothetical protein